MKKIFILSLFVLFSGIQAAEAAKNYTIETNSPYSIQTKNSSNSVRKLNSSEISDILYKDMARQNSRVRGFSDSFLNSFNNGIAGTSDDSTLLSSGLVPTGFDPYLIEINGTKYMLIKDNGDGKFNEKDILGIKDTQKNIFKSLRPLDTNSDSKITGEELEKAEIRLVKINEDGKLDYNNKENDFKNSDIVFIYLTEVRKAYKNDGSTGQFGQYDVVIKNEKGEKTLVTGLVTFETKEQVKKYF